jgi:hypothetical protein
MVKHFLFQDFCFPYGKMKGEINDVSSPSTMDFPNSTGFSYTTRAGNMVLVDVNL